MAKLFQLGLTDVRQARYVRLEAGYAVRDEFGGYGNELKLTGNAWLLSTQADGTAMVLLDQVRVVEVVTPALAEQRAQARVAAQEKDGTPTAVEPEEDPALIVGTWTDADLSADIRALIEYLEKSDGERDYALKRSAAALFLFAVQVHNRGQGAEANRLMALLFEKIGDSRVVLGAAIDRIANVEYANAYRAFLGNGDWAQYLAAVEAALGRYATAWRHAPVATRAAEAVRQHLAAVVPTGAEVEGLSEDDRRIAELLAQPTTVVSLGHPVLGGRTWVLQEPEATPGDGRAPGPLDRIQQRGTAAIPLLVALLGDARLVRVVAERAYDFPHYSADDEPMSEEEIERAWADFPRPWSRGELACRVLVPLVLGGDSEEGGPDPSSFDDLAERSRAWYAQYKGADRATLRRQFLAAGDETVVWQMIRSKDAADREALEAYLLAGEDPMERLGSAGEYARHQGVAAKPFIQRYVAVLKKAAAVAASAEFEPEAQEQRRAQEGKLLALVKNLEDLVSGKTGTQMLQEIVALEKTWNERELQKLTASLLPLLAQEQPGAARTALLQACLNAKDDRLALFLVHCIGYVQWYREREGIQGGAEAEQAKAPTLEEHAGLWAQVLARKGSGGVSLMVDFETMAALVIEGVYGGETVNPELAQTLGDRVYGVTVQRARGRLAGRPAAELPAYPDKSLVGAVRVAEIARLLQEVTREKRPQLVAQLSLSELLVVPEIVAADPELNVKLVPGSHVIGEVRLPEGNEALAKVCLPLKGKAVDRGVVEVLMDECRRQEAQGIDVTAVFERRLPLAGVVLKVSTAGAPAGKSGAPVGTEVGVPSAMLVATLQSAGSEPVRGSLQMPLQQSKAPELPAPAAAADDDLLPTGGGSGGASAAHSQAEFWAGFEQLLAPARSACEPYFCVLMIWRPEPTPRDEELLEQQFNDQE